MATTQSVHFKNVELQSISFRSQLSAQLPRKYNFFITGGISWINIHPVLLCRLWEQLRERSIRHMELFGFWHFHGKYQLPWLHNHLLLGCQAGEQPCLLPVSVHLLLIFIGGEEAHHTSWNHIAQVVKDSTCLIHLQERLEHIAANRSHK